MVDIVLFQPIIFQFRYSIHPALHPLPLGLLSISSLLDKEGYKIKIIDQRFNDNWQKELLSELKRGPICFGVSSKVGLSILNGLNASRTVKENSGIPVIWGGPLPSLLPKQTLENEYVDIVCEGEGDVTFYELVKALEKGKSLKNVKGIWYKNNGNIIRNEKRPFVDLNDMPDMPYHLLNIKDYKNTIQRYNSIPIEYIPLTAITSFGCPSHCKFCGNPILHPHWRALKAKRVIQLIKNIVDVYNSRFIVFMDDDFFIDQKRTNEIMKGILEERLDIIMGFQGIRVDTICKMKKEELDLLYKAGCRHFVIGAESGSQRILNLLNKGITTFDIIKANKRLRKYPEIMPNYNFMSGIPTETIEDLYKTVDIISKLKKDNPNAIIRSIPLIILYPGTKMYDIAIKHGFVPPSSLEEWSRLDNIDFSEDKLTEEVKIRPWLTKEFLRTFEKIYRIISLVYINEYINKMRIHNRLIDINITNNNPLKVLFMLYNPVAKFRLKHNFYNFMPEIKMFNFIRKKDRWY